MNPARNTICIWYDLEAGDAARFYARTLSDSSVGAVCRAHEWGVAWRMTPIAL